MNSYNNMKLHLDRHAYKRGMFKGDAPVEQRAKNHFRVVEGRQEMYVRVVGGQQEMYVRFHNANIITAYEDGSFKLNTNGWASSMTTKMAVSDAAWKFCKVSIAIHNRLVMSEKQLCVRVSGKTYVYYDGMKFSIEGTLLTEAKPFQMRRIDKAQTKQYALDIKESGFKGMFPILYSTCTQEQFREWLQGRHTDDITTRDYEAAKWPMLIAKHKYYGWSGGQEKDMKATWASIMKDAKVDMHNTYASTITVL